MMPDNQTNTNIDETQSAADATVAVNATAMMDEVVSKLGEAHNVLMALSSDPSVDEMCAAIGLSLALDRAGKRATAIYSGGTPNALEFLRPEDTFDTSADILQDFVIALNKDKADHLRYKLDGDYVKIFITPYKTRINEEDLEFSYGDYNIDLVLALDVANGTDLDAALREHGRIMHDATIINVTTGNPGKFGDIQWSDKTASSVCEMATRLLLGVNKATIDKEEATALLTGIVAATNRFSKPNTTAATMEVASQLMAAGADQQLIAQNITADINNEMFGLGSLDQRSQKVKDETALEINHDEPAEVESAEEEPAEENSTEEPAEPEAGALLDDLKAAEESLARAAENPMENTVTNGNTEANGGETQPMENSQPMENPQPEVKPEKVIAPSAEFSNAQNVGDKYEQMVEAALAEGGNPAASVVPAVATEPEINGVPEINYMPMPGDAVLPPPPTPPIDMSNMEGMPPAEVAATPVQPAAPVEPIQPAQPTPETPPEPLGPQPAMQDQVYNEKASDPSAFQIPGA